MFNSDFINEVCMWNEERDNLTYASSLEFSMLNEELTEYIEAAVLGDYVGQADALADIAVVAIGGLYKLCNGNLAAVHDILLAVTSANNLKSTTKDTNGKITKPKGFKGPEEHIRKILEDI